MLTRNKIQRGEGKIKSFDPEARCAPQRRDMADEEAHWELPQGILQHGRESRKTVCRVWKDHQA